MLTKMHQTEKDNTIWFHLCVRRGENKRYKTKPKQTHRNRDQPDDC